MSQPRGFPETAQISPGQGVPPVPTLIPNGQPPHWAKPQTFPNAAKLPRPPLIGQPYQNSSNPLAANGTQTPSHNPGSLSSQSSRDPSPAPQSGASSLSSSTPNLTSLDNSGRQQTASQLPQGVPSGGFNSPLRGNSQPQLATSGATCGPVLQEQRYNSGIQQMGYPAPQVNGPTLPTNSAALTPSGLVRTNMAGTVPPSSSAQESWQPVDTSPPVQSSRRQNVQPSSVMQPSGMGQFQYSHQQPQTMRKQLPASIIGPTTQHPHVFTQSQVVTSPVVTNSQQHFEGANLPPPSRSYPPFQNPTQAQQPPTSIPQSVGANQFQHQQPKLNQSVNSILQSPDNQTRLSKVGGNLNLQDDQNKPHGQFPAAPVQAAGASHLLQPQSSQQQMQISQYPQSPVGHSQGGSQFSSMPNSQLQFPQSPKIPPNTNVAGLPVTQQQHGYGQIPLPPPGQSHFQGPGQPVRPLTVGQTQQQPAHFQTRYQAPNQYQSGALRPPLPLQHSTQSFGQQQSYQPGPRFGSPQVVEQPPLRQVGDQPSQQTAGEQFQTQVYHSMQGASPQQQQTKQELVGQQQQQHHNIDPNWNKQSLGGNYAQQQQHQQEPHIMGRRYPQQPGSNKSAEGLSSLMSGMSVTQQGFNKMWGQDSCDLLQNRNILPPEKIEPPKIHLHQEFLDGVNCSSEIFRCTLTKIPETSSLLQKSRLPLGVLIHPFKDLNHLPVIQCNTIVRCRSCRTYINPFVYFVDHKRWKCNLCFRANELPEEFQFDPVSKSFGDPSRRPEIKSSTIEFIAPSEYMLRPPQPAVYLFVLDVSALAVESGYLKVFCTTLLEELDRMPGDGRTTVGFITFDSAIHFYSLAEGLSQPHQMIVVDTDDVFLPCPDNLLVNLGESRDLVRDLLQQLPQKFTVSHDTQSALGAALQAAHKLISPTGGRVTVFQSCLPNLGPGALASREDPSQRAGKEAPHLNPATDFYKRLALECSGHQVAVDLFLVNSQYCDLATICGISRFSGGCIHHFPLFKATNVLQVDSFQKCLRRYLTRKIGFEAVMRIRCSRGLAIHTFHGNFFVRSTDLLSLPNVNPDAGFGMQISIEESLSDLQNVCFQAALLYTSSKGERRIRVHTLCLPVATSLSDILHSADQQCIVGLLAKMAVDRSHESSLSDARDAFINVAIDVLSAYRLSQGSSIASGGLVAPFSLRLLPLYILALLKYAAFRTGQSTRLDDRMFAMCQMKTLPLTLLIQSIYPDMYPVHSLSDQGVPQENGLPIPQPPRLHLSAEKLDFRGAFLMDTGDHMIMYIGRNISPEFCSNALGVSSFSLIPEDMYDLPVLETTESERLRRFIDHLQSQKPGPATFEVLRDDSPRRGKFLERLIEDRTESALSYYEFLQHLKSNIK